MIDTKYIQKAYADKRKAEADQQSKQYDNIKHTQGLTGSDRIQRAIVESQRLSIEHREGHEPNVNVKNFPKGIAKESDVRKVSEAVNELGISEYLNHTEQVETVTDAIYELIAHLNQLPDKLKNDGFSMLANKLEAMPKPLNRVGITNLEEIKPYFDMLNESIAQIDIKPEVKVEVPKATPLDLSPILEALNKEEAEEIEIPDFMVEDQKTEGSMQYFGLVHPTGAWMIIENDVESGTYKYAFGKDKYSFKKRTSIPYGSITGINALYS